MPSNSSHEASASLDVPTSDWTTTLLRAPRTPCAPSLSRKGCNASCTSSTSPMDAYETPQVVHTNMKSFSEEQRRLTMAERRASPR